MGADKPGTNLSVGHQCDKAFSPILASRVGFVSSDAGAWRRLPLKQPSRQKQRQGQTILLELLAGLGGGNCENERPVAVTVVTGSRD